MQTLVEHSSSDPARGLPRPGSPRMRRRWHSAPQTRKPASTADAAYRIAATRAGLPVTERRAA
jgi:hypothetical protein